MHTDKKYACLNSIKFGIDIMDISHMYALIMCLNSINFAMISEGINIKNGINTFMNKRGIHVWMQSSFVLKLIVTCFAQTK